MGRKVIGDILKSLGSTNTAATKMTLFQKMIRGVFKSYSSRKTIFGIWDPNQSFPVNVFSSRQFFEERFKARYGIVWGDISGNLVHERNWNIDELLQAPGDPMGMGIKYASELSLEERMDLVYVLVNGEAAVDYFRKLYDSKYLGR